jgi:adenosylcobinamide kinase/adenosylcobinamide-phosphate guanylyltransferase
MTLVLLIGGARSGKSRIALERAEREGAPVTFIATGEAFDAEMTERIERHKTERPDAWETIEEPIELERALSSVPDDATAIVDCLSLWVANVFGSRPVEALSAAAARAAAERPGLTIAVNAQWVEAADEALFVVAGRTLALS